MADDFPRISLTLHAGYLLDSDLPQACRAVVNLVGVDLTPRNCTTQSLTIPTSRRSEELGLFRTTIESVGMRRNSLRSLAPYGVRLTALNFFWRCTRTRCACFQHMHSTMLHTVIALTVTNHTEAFYPRRTRAEHAPYHTAID